MYAHTAVDLKIKYIVENTIDKFKVRICGCGNELVQSGTYFNETYSPTVSYITHSTMLQLAIYDQMHLCSIDTVVAFLHQDYPSTLKPLYIILPATVAKACNLDPRTTYRVKKYIYGLPDAGRAYFLAYRHHLIGSGYGMTMSDPCLFVRLLLKEDKRTYVWIHVDDTIVATTHEDEINHLKHYLKTKFEITLHDFTKHLGINVEMLETGAVKL